MTGLIRAGGAKLAGRGRETGGSGAGLGRAWAVRVYGLGMPLLQNLWPTLIAVALLATVTSTVLWGYGAPEFRRPAWAVLRAVIQLALLGTVLSGMIKSPWWTGAALTVMFCVAAWTATRRLGRGRRYLGLVAGAMAAGVVVALGIIFGVGALDTTPRYALALGGIVVGNVMSITTLTGRRVRQGVTDRWDEVEGWLALGAPPPRSTLDIARHAVHEALIPTVDQTRTTGIVTLPGAFVGAIFGGASPLEAGRFQVVVLAAVLAAGSLTAVIVARALSASPTRALGHAEASNA